MGAYDDAGGYDGAMCDYCKWYLDVPMELYDAIRDNLSIKVPGLCMLDPLNIKIIPWNEFAADICDDVENNYEEW